MNGKKATPPCPCGYRGHPRGTCRCTPAIVARYRSKVSGPLLDRIDLHLEVPPLEESALDGPPGEASARVRERVAAARERQRRRQGMANAGLAPAELDGRVRIDSRARALLRSAASKLALSARAHHRVLKVARTIADLAGRERVDEAHVAEALSYRAADPKEAQPS